MGPVPGRDVKAHTRLSFRQAITGATVSLRKSDGQTVRTKIPAGVKDGATIRIRGKGEAGPQGGPAGDLLVTVSVDAHPVFSRRGSNLLVTVPVTFAEATLGATIEVPTLSGESVHVKVPAGTPSGRMLRVKGRGVKTAKAVGDLLVTVEVVVPAHLSSAARAAVEKLAAETGDENPRSELLAKARAVVRAGLWDAARHAPAGSLPTPPSVVTKTSMTITMTGNPWDIEVNSCC